MNAVTIEKLEKAKSLFEWSSLADEERVYSKSIIMRILC